MTKEYEWHLVEYMIKEIGYPGEELQQASDLKLILEHACTVGYLTEDEKVKLQAVFQ